jgi:hypothetical protein
MNILIYPAASEIAREVFESLKDNKDLNLIGGTSSNFDKSHFIGYQKILNIPFISNDHESDFVKNIYNILLDNSIDYIFPCHDDVSLILSELIPNKTLSHNYQINKICRYKNLTYNFLQSTGLIPEINPIIYPRFVKPINSNGSKGAELIKNEKELESYYLKYNKTNTLELEYLPGDEYTVDCFSEKGCLLFSGARQRNTTKMGIAELSIGVDNNEINSIAEIINNEFIKKGGFDGAWFFQLKKDINDKYKLLEIGPRISGGMSFYRMRGINFSILTILTKQNINNLKIQDNKIKNLKFSKFFIPKYKYDGLKYENIYVDFDDTLYIHKDKKLNLNLIKLLYQGINEKKKLVLITRSRNNFKSILNQYKINNIWDEIIHITDDTPKHKFITNNSVFIDDSFSERDFIKENVYCFGVDNFNLLIQE